MNDTIQRHFPYKGLLQHFQNESITHVKTAVMNYSQWINAPETMKVHQVITVNITSISSRNARFYCFHS